MLWFLFPWSAAAGLLGFSLQCLVTENPSTLLDVRKKGLKKQRGIAEEEVLVRERKWCMNHNDFSSIVGEMWPLVNCSISFIKVASEDIKSGSVLAATHSVYPEGSAHISKAGKSKREQSV